MGMFDYQDMKGLFRRMGLEFTEGGRKSRRPLDEVPDDAIAHDIRIGEGSGYAGFSCTFFFDKDGKFLGHTCEE